MVRKIVKLISLIAVFFLITGSFAGAATISFDIEGVESLPSLGYDRGIAGFIWDFDYVDTTTLTATLGDAVSVAWFVTSTIDKPESGILQVEAVDMMFTSPMTNGTILTLEYDGTINWNTFYGWEFRDYSNNTINEINFKSSVLTDGGNTTFAQVPIPGAIWLLGSGLLGLVTIRRRRAKV